MDLQESAVAKDPENDFEISNHHSFMEACKSCWKVLPNYIKAQVFTYITIATIVYGGLVLTRDDSPLLDELYSKPARQWTCSNDEGAYTLVEVLVISEMQNLNDLEKWMIDGEPGSIFNYQFPVEIETGVFDSLSVQITKNYVAGLVEFEILPIFTEDYGYSKQINLDTGQKIIVPESMNALRSLFNKNIHEDSSSFFYVIPQNNGYVKRFEILPNNIVNENDFERYSCSDSTLVNLRNSISMEIEKVVKATE